MTAPAPARWPEVLRLIEAAGLPTADLSDAHRGRFLVETDAAGRVAGCVGVERHGADGLLRSLAVAEGARGRGVGGRLVAAAEAAARAEGLRALYLLTTTAAPFFAARGYAPVDRADVPPAVRASSEYCGVCPSSAASMGKPLGPA